MLRGPVASCIDQPLLLDGNAMPCVLGPKVTSLVPILFAAMDVNPSGLGGAPMNLFFVPSRPDP